MKQKKSVALLALAAVFVLLLAGAYVLYNHLSEGMQPSITAPEVSQSPEGSETPEVTEEQSAPEEQETVQPAAAPDFTVVDGDGNEVRLSDMVGKPVVVNFWASWCSPCKSEMPDFDAAYAEYGDEVHFMMVNLTDGSRETVESAKSFIAEAGYSFPVYFDTQSSAAIAYGTYSIPATYFIDAEGNAIAYGVGALSASVLQQGIDMILPQ